MDYFIGNVLEMYSLSRMYLVPEAATRARGAGGAGAATFPPVTAFADHM